MAEYMACVCIMKVVVVVVLAFIYGAMSVMADLELSTNLKYIQILYGKHYNRSKDKNPSFRIGKCSFKEKDSSYVL